MFKVGDKVVLVSPYANIELGSTGVVTHVRGSMAGTCCDGKQISQMVSVKFQSGKTISMFDPRLAHAQQVVPLRMETTNPMQMVVDTADRIFPRRSYDTILKSLMEELGELSTEIAIEQGTKDRAPSPDGVKGEAVDVFVVAVDMLRAAWGDDLFSAEFDAKVAEKLAKWERK